MSVDHAVDQGPNLASLFGYCNSLLKDLFLSSIEKHCSMKFDNMKNKHKNLAFQFVNCS